MHGKRSAMRGTAIVGSVVAFAACSMIGGGMPFGTETEPRDTRVDEEVRAAADASADRRIVISVKERQLWLIEGQDTLLAAPVAVGRDQTFEYNGETFNFRTPRGQRRVIEKAVEPVWRPPAWHYYEKASYRGLEPVEMEPGERYELSDGTHLEVRGENVGRVNRFGNFRPWTPGKEIIFDGKIFIPPFGTRQRDVPDALGTHGLYLGDGYLIHGTHRGNRDSIGRAASHGCVRMYNEDLQKLYSMVDVGTPVYIH